MCSSIIFLQTCSLYPTTISSFWSSYKDWEPYPCMANSKGLMILLKYVSQGFLILDHVLSFCQIFFLTWKYNNKRLMHWKNPSSIFLLFQLFWFFFLFSIPSSCLLSFPSFLLSPSVSPCHFRLPQLPDFSACTF